MHSMFASSAPTAHPFSYLPPHGGLCRTIGRLGCIGDSLSAGEIVTKNPDGTLSYVDHYELAWGAYFSKLCGVETRIFARGGMTAREFNASFAKESGFYLAENRCDSYVIALGVNDLYHGLAELGTPKSKEDGTFSADLQAIISAIRAFGAEIPVYLMTMPHDHRSEAAPHIGDAHASLLHALAEKDPNLHVLDFRAYAPPYDEAFRETYFLHGHLNAAGYHLKAQMIPAYIDFILRREGHDTACNDA